MRILLDLTRQAPKCTYRHSILNKTYPNVLHNKCRLVQLVSDCLPAGACVLQVSYFRSLSHVYHPITYPSFKQLPSFEQSHVVMGICFENYTRQA